MIKNRLVLTALAVALVQIGVLSSMIVGRASILRSGQEILLEVQPVDPRDLLRGDFVMLGYNISLVPHAVFVEPPAETDDQNEREVYIRLRPDSDGVWQPLAASFEGLPTTPLREGEVDIKGRASRIWEGDRNIRIRYGIERFYLPEGEGKAIEEDLRERSFRMRVAVAKDGTAQIKALLDGETTLFEEPIY